MQLKLPQKPLFKERINQSANIHSVGLHCKPGHSSGRHRCLHRQHMGQQAAFFSPNSPLPGRKTYESYHILLENVNPKQMSGLHTWNSSFFLDTQCIISTPSTIIFILSFHQHTWNPKTVPSFMRCAQNSSQQRRTSAWADWQNLPCQRPTCVVANFQNYDGFIHFQAIIHLGFFVVPISLCSAPPGYNLPRAHAHGLDESPGDEEACTNQRWITTSPTAQQFQTEPQSIRKIAVVNTCGRLVYQLNLSLCTPKQTIPWINSTPLICVLLQQLQFHLELPLRAPCYGHTM